MVHTLFHCITHNGSCDDCPKCIHVEWVISDAVVTTCTTGCRTIKHGLVLYQCSVFGGFVCLSE